MYLKLLCFVTFLVLGAYSQNVRKVVSVYPGQNAVLKCINEFAEAFNPRYQWEKPQGNVISNDFQITIPNVGPRDVGIYTCRMTAIVNGRPSTSVASLRLELRGGGSQFPPNPVDPNRDFNLVITHAPVNIEFNQRLTLDCQTVPPVNGVIFQWFVNNVPTGRGATLVIDRFMGQHSTKEYKCTASYMGRTAKSAIATFNFRAYDQRELMLSPPPGPGIAVRVGQKKELHCEISNFASGITGQNIQWFFNGNLINDRSNGMERLDQQRVSILVLTRISKQNEGRYECRLQNEVKEAFVIVIGGRVPTLEVNPGSHTVNEGRNGMVEFHCRIAQHPTLKNRDLRWYFQPLNSGSRQSLRNGWDRKDNALSDETSFISLVGVLKSDEGYYICESPDDQTARAQLTVTGQVVARIEISINPNVIQGRPGQTYQAICSVRNNGQNFGQPMWRLENGLPITSDRRFSVQQMGPGMSRINIIGLSSRDNGLTIQCYYQSYTATLRISLSAVCGPADFRCNNGQCVPSGSRCNGYRDCADGSDEIALICQQCDPLEKKCGYMNGVAPLKQIFSANWQCDGEDDCGNGFDEQNCLSRNSPCGGTHFQCNSYGRTNDIPMAFRCDTERDCPNGEDEIGCSPAPLLIDMFNSTQFHQTVRPGSTITFSCRGKGTPMPSIIWRYNWRCLPNKRRMIVTSNKVGCEYVESTLTISNVVQGENGIYNCELISASKRALSRDYQLIVNPY